MSTTRTELTVNEVAERLSVSPRTVRRWIANGDLPAYKVGPSYVRVREADLGSFMRRIKTR